MSGMRDRAEDADRRIGPRNAWVTRVLRGVIAPVQPPPVTAADPRIGSRIAANQNIAVMLDAASARDPSMPLWSEPTQGEMSDARQRSVQMILAEQFDEGFQQREARKRKATAAALAADESVQRAHAEWPDWYADQKTYGKQIEAFIATVLAKQGKIIGLGDTPPQVLLGKSADNATSFGNFNVQSGKIEIAKVHPDFAVFLNTLTHENTHAFQAKLVEELESDLLETHDPDYHAALALQMNREHGYISPELAAQFNPDDRDAAYKKQCSEAHAFAAGDEVSAEVVKQLDAKLPAEQRQKNSQRTQLAVAQLDKLQDEIAAKEDADEAQAFNEDMEYEHRKIMGAQKDAEWRAQHDRENMAAEEARRQKDLEETTEIDSVEDGNEKLFANLARQDPAGWKDAVMEQAGFTSDEYDAFVAAAKLDLELTPKMFKQMLHMKSKKAGDLATIRETFGLDDDEMQFFIELQEQYPNESPENIVKEVRS